MFKRQWRKFIRMVFVGGVAAALLGSGSTYAADKDDLQVLKQQLEQQKKQMEQQKKDLELLQKQLTHLNEATAAKATADLPPAPKADAEAVRQLVGDELKRREAEQAAAAAAARKKIEDEGYKVGTDLSMSVRWNPLNGVTFFTPNGDFVSHMGFRFQLDDVFFNQSPGLKNQPGTSAKNGGGGIGDLQDGDFFRRVRPSYDGQAWEVMEWNCELALEQIQHDLINFDECWVGIMNMPLIGTIRIGHQHPPQGLEDDMTASSKAMTFLERSMYTDAFYENFATGVLNTNNFFDQRATYMAMIYRQDNYNGSTPDGANVADTFGDGKYAYGLRATALPIWENDGRCFMHVGASIDWREADDVNAATGQGGTVGPRFVDFRARPQIRDGIGDYGSTGDNVAGLPGNQNRIVDTGVMTSSSSTVIGTEWAFVRGPLFLMAEYGFAEANDVTTSATTFVSNSKIKAGTNLGDCWFNGGYIQATYFLTGESRTYDRRLGRLGTNYITSPFTPFYFTRGEDGGWLFGRGAWEVAARYNYLNLDDKGIQGGISHAVELGVNWYLNTNLKIQFEYLWQDRTDMTSFQNGVNANRNNGSLNGLGIRTQFFF